MIHADKYRGVNYIAHTDFDSILINLESINGFIDTNKTIVKNIKKLCKEQNIKLINFSVSNENIISKTISQGLVFARIFLEIEIINSARLDKFIKEIMQCNYILEKED